MTALAVDALQECYVSSKSRPGYQYRMVYAPVSGWVHADSDCPARVECRHRRLAEAMTNLVVRGESTDLSLRPTLLVEYDAEAISRGVDVAVAAKWAYDLGSSGKGVGVRGVEEGVRLLSSRGEIVRVESCVMVSDTPEEAFFNATATRYVIHPDTGAEIKLDSQTRGKRVSKWQEHADEYMRQHPTAPRMYLNPNWYELGIVKASRNAALALMPSNIKSALLKAGLDAIDKTKRGGSARSSQAPSQPARNAAPANGAQEALSTFWADTRAAQLEPDYVINESQRLFNNREPKDLTSEERVQLFKTLTKTVNVEPEAPAPGLGI